MENKSVRILVKGRVQGVFFRKYTKDFADAVGLKGKVRNCENGDVEIFAIGREEAVNALINWTYSGSPLSKVNEVLVENATFEAEQYLTFFVEQGRF